MVLVAMVHLHQGFKTGGVRRLYGSTRSEGLNRGTLVKHNTDLSYVGGSSKGRLSLHSIDTGKRLCQNAKVIDCKILTKQSWRTAFLPRLKPVGFLL